MEPQRGEGSSALRPRESVQRVGVGTVSEERIVRTQILMPQQSVGLMRDAETLGRVLSDAGWASTVTVAGARSVRAQAEDAARRARGRAGFDLNIFLEVPVRRWLNTARASVLIPNQEWFQESHRAMLGRIDRVLCKTRHAEGIFTRLGAETAYTGFVGVDRLDPTITLDFDAFLHVAGSPWRSETSAVLEAWSRHPEWPVLTVVRSVPVDAQRAPPNVRVIRGPIPDAELRTLQNRCGVHVCPSEMEGYGHLLSEGASAGALVMTTDADPMRELITPDRGVLIPTTDSEPHHHGVRHRFTPEAVEAGVGIILGMESNRRATIGQAGRAWFERNRTEASGRLVKEMLAAMQSR